MTDHTTTTDGDDLESGVWYFAYGANMDRPTLVERRRIEPQEEQVGMLQGFALCFDQPGLPLIEPVFANLRREEGASVHGVLYRLSTAQLKQLDQLEGGGAYLHLEVDVQAADGRDIQAKTYLARSTVDGRYPSRRYMDLLLRGARDRGLPEAWISRLENQKTGGWAWAAPLARVVMGFFEILFRLGVRSPRNPGR
jgi:cation transport regulator ChaC